MSGFAGILSRMTDLPESVRAAVEFNEVNIEEDARAFPGHLAFWSWNRALLQGKVIHAKTRLAHLRARLRDQHIVDLETGKSRKLDDVEASLKLDPEIVAAQTRLDHYEAEEKLIASVVDVLQRKGDILRTLRADRRAEIAASLAALDLSDEQQR